MIRFNSYDHFMVNNSRVQRFNVNFSSESVWFGISSAGAAGRRLSGTNGPGANIPGLYWT